MAARENEKAGMSSKRVLYHPAPSSSRTGQAARKPLVQGRLITDNDPFNIQAGGRDEPPDDPSILPANSLPVLTEDISPRPEPLQCLDLSDSDTDIPESFDLNRPKHVLVFDASRQKDLSHGAELEVVVGYEDSPARVVCHTPGKLERSFLEERRAVLDSGGDGPNWAVKVDRVQNVNSFGVMSEKPSLTTGDGSHKKIKEAKNRSQETSDRHHNRGIIEEILVQELGNSNFEAISLGSETTELSPQSLNDATASEKSQYSSDTRRNEELPSLSYHSTNPMTGSHDLSQTSQSKQKTKKVKNKFSFPQPKFEDDSDTSSDRVPVKEMASNRQTKVCEHNSESEICSLYEYVTSNKSQEKQADYDKMAPVSSKIVQDLNKIEVSQPTKKRPQKTRKVASRYLQSSANKASILPSKNPSADPSLSRPNPRSQPLAPAASKQLREKLHIGAGVTSKKPAPGKSSRSTNVLPVKPSNSRAQPSVMVPTQQSFIRSDSPQEELRSSETSSKDQKTSTPTHDQVCHLSQDIDASAIQSVSTMSMNMSCAGVLRHWPSILENVDTNLKKFPPEKFSNKRNDKPAHGRVAGGKPQRKSQLQVDLEYSRFLQMVFLSCKAKKAYEQQDKVAQSQVHELWKLVESARERNTQLKMDVSRLDGLIKHDNLLDMMEADLETVMPLVPELEAAYSRLSSELDTTRHQLPTRDMYVPAAGTEERDVYEEQLKTALTESQQLLSELDELTSSKTPPLSQYLIGAEAIDNNVSSMYQTLQSSQRDVAAIQGLTTRLMSLNVQDM